MLDWKLRNDPSVVVLERNNAMHDELPEVVDIVTIDVAWTRQRNILPRARKLVRETGRIVSLIKPHYEADAALLRKGILPDEHQAAVMAAVKIDIADAGFSLLAIAESPIQGAKGNREFLAHLQPIR